MHPDARAAEWGGTALIELILGCGRAQASGTLGLNWNVRDKREGWMPMQLFAESASGIAADTCIRDRVG